MFTHDFPDALPDDQPSLPIAISEPQGPHCVALSFKPQPKDVPQQPIAQPTPAKATFRRPRVRGLLKTARRSRPTPPSEHTGSSPPTPPPIAHGDPWDRLRSFSHDQSRKRPLGEEGDDGGRERWTSPDPFSEFDYDSDSSAASLSRHHLHRSHSNHHHHHHHHHPQHPGKRRRGDLDDIFYDPDPDYSPPTSTDDTSLEEEIVYWDYSRKCNPNSEKKNTMWKTRSKLMDTSSIGGSSSLPVGANARSVAAAHLLQQQQDQKQKDRQSTDLEDWEFLKEMFANAAQTYESQPHSKTIPLLRGVINECNRFLKLFHDPSLIYAGPSSSPTSPGGRKASHHHHHHKPISVSASASPPTENPVAAVSCCTSAKTQKSAEKKCKCKDLPTAFYTVFGTSLFFFGNIVDTSPELCLPGEPSNPVVYWLAALDAFEIGENLPVRTNGHNFASLEHVKSNDGRSSPSPLMSGKSLSGYQSDNSSIGYFNAPPEDWRMAVIWGRTLVAIAEELVRRQNEREKDPAFVAAQQSAQGMQEKSHEMLVDALFSRAIAPQMPVAPAAPFAYAVPAYPFSVSSFFGGPRVQMNTAVPNNNADTPSWPAESPLATLLSRRPHVPRRMSLDSGVTPHQLLVLAQDQFSRGILHMPHPQHQARDGGSKEKKPFSAFLQPRTPHCEAEDNTSTAHHGASELPTFSRAKELYAIAFEVLLLSEKLESASERQQWASWANNVFSQMKMEADTDVARWRGLLPAARGKCFVVVGGALAEGVEDRLEAAGEGKEEESVDEILNCEDAIDARDALRQSISYLEKAKDDFVTKMGLDAQGGVVVVAKEGEGDLDEEDDGDEEMILETEEEEEEDLEKPTTTTTEDATPKPSRSTTGTTTTTAAAPQTVSFHLPTKTANTPEEEIAEIKELLAEVLVSLANLTADKREREQLYQRAQAESDKIVLDDDGEDERMDEGED